MADLVTWVPVNDGTGQVPFRQRKVRFGDGYSQVTTDGLNPIQRSWPLTFTGTGSVISAIAAFLEDHAAEPFEWKPPLRASVSLFLANGYSLRDLGGDVWSLSATFEEWHSP